MFLRVFASDLIKIRRKMIWFLICLGPAGVVGLQAANFGLRYDYLMNLYKDDLWGGVIANVGYLTVPTLLMGLTIIASMIANVEHQTNAWKQTVALPVTRLSIFTGKFTLTAFLLLCSSLLLGLGTSILGVSLGIPAAELPYDRLCMLMFYTYLAAMPFTALQVWLSIAIGNQAIPLTVGITGAVISLWGGMFGDWAPWKWPYLANRWDEPLFSAAAGLSLGLLLFVMGLIGFIRKDVR